MLCVKIFVSVLAGFALSSHATLLLHYDFDAADAANKGSLGGAGAVFGGLTFVPSGADGTNPLAGQAAQFNRSTANGANGANDAAIDTLFTATALSISGAGGGYTTMAWMRFDGAAGDVMIFGQDLDPAGGSPSATGSDNPQLHHGIRNDDAGPTPSFHFGHWGNDINNPVGTAVVGQWMHVAYTWDPTNGANLFVNGANMGTNPGAGALNGGADGANVTIGWMDRVGQGSFDGALDEVRIYDTVLNPAEIAIAMQTIPEPSSFALLGCSLLGMLAYRRRVAK
jgi:hypothetical protein